MNQIKYHLTKFAWSNYIPILENIICDNKLHKILEIGGGANPILSPKFVKELQLDYTINDINENELLKMEAPFQIQISNYASKDFHSHQEYDLIFSKMVMEHIEDVEQFHKNIFQALKPGGFAFHFFPCFSTLPLIINYYINEKIARKILSIFQSRNLYKNDKFPAYYNWCFGPTKKNINRFENLGFKLISYYGFFGHQYYKKIKLLHFLEQMKGRFLVKNPNPKLTVNAFLILKKVE